MESEEKSVVWYFIIFKEVLHLNINKERKKKYFEIIHSLVGFLE